MQVNLEGETKMEMIIDHSLDNRTFIIDGKRVGLAEMIKNYPTPPKKIHLNQKNADIMMNRALEHGDMFNQIKISEKKEEKENGEGELVE